jgi:hypothetical protein
MKNTLILAILFSVLLPDVVSQVIRYDVASIPDSLTKNVSIVKRYEHTIFEVTDIDKTSTKIHCVYTILNKNGEHALRFQEYSNSFRQLDNVDIKVYDQNGKQTERYKRKDLYTRALVDGLIDDAKGHFFVVPAVTYPITIEYIYEIKNKGTLNYPKFEIITPGESVEYTSFTAKVPKNLDLRYKAQNIQLNPVVTENGNTKIYDWVVRQQKPIDYEEGSVSYESRYPSVLLAPNKFKMDNYEGDMSTWKGFGAWETNMQRGLEILPEERKLFFKDLVKDAGSDKEKVKLVYEYLQKNFRYVSIQLGIGGYKPFAADFTDKKKYGDCKGLSFYMHSVLAALNIKSYTALINSQYNKAPVDPGFPCNQFNHMILFVPLASDSVWLECTSNTSEFGVLGNSTENRNALLITETGGLLVPTPKSKAEDNVFTAYTLINLEENGAGTCTSDVKASGRYREEFAYYLDEKNDDQKSYLVRRWGFKQPDEFLLKKHEDSKQFGVNLLLAIEKIPEFTAGTKMFLTSQIYTGLLDYKLPKSDNRRLDYYFEHPFVDTDTTVYKLPEGFTPDVLPPSKSSICEYGSFTSKYWYDDKERKIFSTVKVILNQNVIPAAKYASVKTFFDAVQKEGSQRIVIKKG